MLVTIVCLAKIANSYSTLHKPEANSSYFETKLNSFPDVARYTSMSVSSRDITSCNILWRSVLHEHKGQDRGGEWVHLKVANSMIVSGSALATPRLALGGLFLSSYA